MSYCWYFTQEEIKEKTPSREEGISPSAEARYRKDGARFIINASNTLGLRYDTMATGVVFFHRFYMVQSFKQFDRWVVGAACLLLAGKVEETPKKCKDILKVTRSLLNDQQMAGFGNNPKEELLTHERILLQTVKFDLQLEHPYSYLLKFAKELKGEKSRIEKLVQMAWTFVNDSLCTTLCLQWEPQAIAVAFLYLAGKLTKFDLQSLSQSKSRSWWRQFVDTLDFHDLESICHQVLDIYGERDSDKKSESAPDEVDSAVSQQTPPTSTAAQPLYPTGSVAVTTPTQGQLLAIHHHPHHRYPSNHHSPSPVPPLPPTLGAAATAMAVAPPTSTVNVIQPQAPGSLQPSQVAYIVGQQQQKVTYNLADPLQALQAMRPATVVNSGQSQPQGQPGVAAVNAAAALTTLQQIPTQTSTVLPYSTLNVSVGNTTTALPRAPGIHQTFSQLPGGQIYQPQTALGAQQALQKNLSMTANASSIQQGSLRTGLSTNYQQINVLPGVASGTGIQAVVMPQTVTGTGIGTVTQLPGGMRIGQTTGLAQSQPTLGQVQGTYLTPPATKRAAYDLKTYHVSPGAGVLQATNLRSQNIATAGVVAGGANTGGVLSQTTLTAQQHAKPPSLLTAQTSNSLTLNRLPSLMSQQPNTLYRSNSQPSSTQLVAAIAAPSQLPPGGGTIQQQQQLSALSAMTQIAGGGRGMGVVTGGHLPTGQLHGVMGMTGTSVRSALPQPAPSPTARPQTGYGLQQQNYGGSAGRGAGWGMS